MKKKILFITLSMEGGGAEKIMASLLRNLKSEMEICLVTLYAGGRFLDEAGFLQGMTYHTLRAERGNTITFTWRLRKILLKEKPDKIISFLYYPNIITYLAVNGLDIPIILSERSNHRFYLTRSFKHRVWRFLLGQAYRKAEKVVTVSDASAKFIMNDFGIAAGKIRTIYNGISFKRLDELKDEPVTEIDLPSGTRYILTAGSLSRSKNHALLIDAFRLVKSRHEKISLVILGKGEMEEVLKKQIGDSGLNGSVFMPGYALNPYKFMAGALCFVLSSKWEGFPNVLLEAMYVNGHVVSTDCPTGPSEIITNGVDGILCRSNDAEDLAAGLEKICFDEDLREKVYLKSRGKIINFGEERMVEEYRELLMN